MANGWHAYAIAINLQNSVFVLLDEIEGFGLKIGRRPG
jgi:hypothetical protein